MGKEQDELFELQFKEDLKNKEQELARLEKSIAEHKEILSEMEGVAVLWKAGIPVVTENCRKIEPVFEYEKLDSYWELQEKLLRLEFFRKYYSFTDQEIPHMQKTVAAKEKALVDLREAINKMKGDEKQ